MQDTDKKHHHLIELITRVKSKYIWTHACNYSRVDSDELVYASEFRILINPVKNPACKINLLKPVSL